MIVLDHVRSINLDPSDPPLDNYQAFEQNYAGLKILADSVREEELKMLTSPYHDAILFTSSHAFSPIVSCSFNWFSVTLVNYLRLIALVELMNVRSWKSVALRDSANRIEINQWCTDFVKDAVPEIYLWRNKVSAHFAATYPFNADNLGTLEQSIMNPVSFVSPYFYVGFLKWNSSGEESQLPEWSLTKTYEELSTRFWPNMKLRPFT